MRVGVSNDASTLLLCHSEQSEESVDISRCIQILRIAQNDTSHFVCV